MKSDIRSLYPSIYKDILEIDALTRAEDSQHDTFFTHMEEARQNQFAETADVRGLEAMERLYSIRANPKKESLALRRERLLLRMQTAPPFTMPWLRGRLDELFGEGGYTLAVQGNDYLIRITTGQESERKYMLLRDLLLRVLPANMFWQRSMCTESQSTIYAVPSSHRYIRQSIPLTFRNPDIPTAVVHTSPASHRYIQRIEGGPTNADNTYTDNKRCGA